MTRKELLNSPEYWQEIAETQCYNEGVDYTLQLVDKQQMIDKIVKWIDENAFEYVKTKTYGIDNIYSIDKIYKGFDSDKMIADIKKTMEESDNDKEKEK